MDRYQREHAPLFQALREFERLANRYPNTPAAPKALYSAALCAAFLPELEYYWYGASYAGRSFPELEVHFYRRVQREYPGHPLARAAAKFGGPLPARRPSSSRGRVRPPRRTGGLVAGTVAER